MVQKVAVKREFEAGLPHATTGKLSLLTQQCIGTFFRNREEQASGRRGMGSAFQQLCSRYSGTLIPTAPTAITLWETFSPFYAQFSIIFFMINIYQMK